MAREPIGSMMENVPSQIDEDELAAEVEVEIPDSLDMGPVPENVEIMEEDDGSVIVDFEPQDQRGTTEEFSANLAEEMPDGLLGRIASELTGEFDENKSGRQEGFFDMRLLEQPEKGQATEQAPPTRGMDQGGVISLKDRAVKMHRNVV